MNGVTPPDLREVFDPAREREARLARRFYKDVGVRETPEGAGVWLDGRELRSPAKKPLRLPSRDAAELVAQEWRAQDKRIDPATMPVTRIVWTGLDRIGPDRGPARDEILAHAETDLVCYRADTPAELVARQGAVWDPLLAWLAGETGARLKPTTGIMHVAQASEALAALAGVVADLDPIRLAALHTLVTLTGSFVIGFAVLRGHLDADAAWRAARIDEDYQQAQWGEDAEAAALAAARLRDLRAATQLLRAL